jgi:hypothetical protein
MAERSGQGRASQSCVCSFIRAWIPFGKTPWQEKKGLISKQAQEASVRRSFPFFSALSVQRTEGAL